MFLLCGYEGGAGEEAGVDHQVQAALQAAVGTRLKRAGQVQTGTVETETDDCIDDRESI